MAAPDHIKRVLEFSSARVFDIRDANFFTGDAPMDEVTLSASPLIKLRKTGGTTGHREQGRRYIHYQLQIPAMDILYSIYILPSADNAGTNQAALARAIRWFIAHYEGGSTYSRDEPAV